MKKMILYCFLIAGLGARAQKEFQGMAVYESKTTADDFKGNVGGREITPDMRKSFLERMKNVLEKTYILNFDKSASIYKEEQKLEAPGTGRGGGLSQMLTSMMGMGGTFYKNIKDRTFTVDREFLGKDFLVTDSLPKPDWKLEEETKQIGGYNCFKATAVRPASKSDLRNLRPKRQQQEKEDPAAPKSTNLMDAFEMPDNVTVTAWYTPEIPVSQGPENYWGLPGLILEVSDGKTVILCSKIVMNVKEKVTIKAPEKGTKVTQKEYDEVVVKKRKEMQDMRRNGQGQGRNARFGGN